MTDTDTPLSKAELAYIQKLVDEYSNVGLRLAGRLLADVRRLRAALLSQMKATENTTYPPEHPMWAALKQSRAALGMKENEHG